MSSPITAAGLTLQQERFAQALIACSGNASEAFRRVNPDSLSWLPDSVYVAASRLLALDKVALRVASLAAEALDAEQVTPHWIVGKLKSEAVSEREDASAHSRIRALEVLAKHRRMLDDHATVDVRAGILVVQSGFTLPPLPLAASPLLTGFVDQLGPGSDAEAPASDDSPTS